MRENGFETTVAAPLPFGFTAGAARRLVRRYIYKPYAGLSQENREGICRAAEVGDADAVKAFYALGVGLETRGHGRMTPLLAAAKGGSAECMELLLGLGADRCACAPGGATLLMVAAGSASAACVQLALAAGADVNARSATGDTPLGSAAAVGAAGCMQLLLAAGADACVRDKKWAVPWTVFPCTGTMRR